jgi:hypothetical protein
MGVTLQRRLRCRQRMGQTFEDHGSYSFFGDACPVVGSGCRRAASGDPENKRGDPSALFRTNAWCRTSAYVGGPDQ